MTKTWSSRWNRTFVLGSACAAMLAMGGCAPASVDEGEGAVASEALQSAPTVVLDWNVTTHSVAAGPMLARAATMVHVAMFDAVNSVNPRYDAYLVSEAVSRKNTSDVAAAAQAAYRVLIRLFPAKATELNAALAASLAGVPNGAGKDAGIALGDSVGNQIVDARASDNYALPNPAYVPGTAPDSYTPTGPNPVNQTAKDWVPFALDSASQFRAPAPPDIFGEAFAADFAESKTLGCAGPACPHSADEATQIRWHAVEQAGPQFNRLARAAVTKHNMSLIRSARLFALLNIAIADATQAVFESKYAYNRIRPVTLITGTLIDGTADAWAPFIGTPPHPEYPAAHSTVQNAAGQVMNAIVGPDYAFDTTAAVTPAFGDLGTRHYDSFDAFVAEGSNSRVIGGIHFRNSTVVGLEQGRQVGQFILANTLLPHDD